MRSSLVHDRINGAFWNRHIATGAKSVVAKSVVRSREAVLEAGGVVRAVAGHGPEENVYQISALTLLVRAVRNTQRSGNSRRPF